MDSSERQQILRFSVSRRKESGDVAQLVRALPCHGRGRGFEPRRPRHTFQKTYGIYGTLVTSKSGSDKGPLRSDASFLRVHLTRVLTHARNHHPYNLALCGALIGAHCLRVDIQCDPAVRVP